MKIFLLNGKEASSGTDPYLVSRLNSDMNYCTLKPEIQKGFLFYLGAAINIGINKGAVDLRQHLATPESEEETAINIMNAYSQSTGDFSDYGDLNDLFLHQMIYTCNSILYQLTGQNPSEIDNKLRYVEFYDLTPLKIAVNEDLQEKYADLSFNLNTCHNLFEDIFYSVGDHLHQKGYDLSRSYEAGYAYFCLQANVDIHGVYFLLSTIHNFLTPLYRALFIYPIVNFANPFALKSNHIFSSTLQHLYPDNPPIIQPVHRYHQHVFYAPKNNNLRSIWDFESRNDTKIEMDIFMNAVNIRNTDIMSLKNHFLALDLMCPELINASVNREEFYMTIVLAIHEKYGIAPARAIENQEVWNNLGDLIQYFCIFFYETCMHAVVLDEING